MCGNCILAFVVVEDVTSTSSVCISLIPALLLLLLLVEELEVDLGRLLGDIISTSESSHVNLAGDWITALGSFFIAIEALFLPPFLALHGRDDDADESNLEGSLFEISITSEDDARCNAPFLADDLNVEGSLFEISITSEEDADGVTEEVMSITF